MSDEDFWEVLARGHSASTYPSSVDLHLSGNPPREKFTSVRELTDLGRRSSALELPVPAGTMVLFAGDLGATLSMVNPPEKGMPGEVVTVKSAGGEVTSYDGMVFVKWADGVFRQVHAEYLRLAPVPKTASSNAEFVRSVHNRGRMPAVDLSEYPPIRGMEGPFRYPSGKILYYDPREGAYYDRKTDMYLGRNEKLAAKKDDDPCWEGYEMFGMKEKGDKKVPNCIPQKKAAVPVNRYMIDVTFGTFVQKYFQGKPKVSPEVAKMYWDDFRYNYVGSLRSYIKDTTPDEFGNVRRKLPASFRVASLGDLTGFLRIAEGTLVNKSSKDLWSFNKDADGKLTVERMFDAKGKPLKA